MEIERLPIDAPAWSAFVAAHPASLAFHNPAWAQLLAECYGYSPFVMAVTGEAGRVRAGMPFTEVRSRLTGRRWVSLPFTDHCPPLSYDAADLQRLVAYLAEMHAAERIPRVEIHGPTSCAAAHEERDYVTHQLALAADPERLFRAFDRAIRQKTRQARERGASIRWCRTQEDLLAFYDLLVQTRSRLGVPVQPKRFFRLLWRRLIAPGLGFALLAYADGRPIAGDVFLHYGTTLTAKYNASDPKYWSLRANNLLYWTAIEWGCEHGFQTFDFGRSDLEDHSLRDYKDRWGAKEQPLVYSTIGGRGQRSWSPLAGALRAFVRHSGPQASRLLGELFYRHFA